MGDVVAFKGVLAAHEATFRADLTLPLIARLHQNVIKTGLRKISLTCVPLWTCGLLLLLLLLFWSFVIVLAVVAVVVTFVSG